MVLAIHRVAVACLLLVGVHRPCFAYSDLVIFGDSLSDTGNLASVTVDFIWPYYMNRVSNGPLAVDVLAGQLGLSAEASLHLAGESGGGNYAVDGANASGGDPEDLDRQLSAYLGRTGGLADPAALYVVMIGGNDLRDARNRSTLAAGEKVVDAAVLAIRQAAASLLSRGAQKVLLVNGPDIGRIPETLELEDDEPGISARASTLTRRFNSGLASTAAALSGQYGGKLVPFDLYSHFNALLSNATAHGFTNTTEGCFDPGHIRFHVDCAWGTGFDRFVFFDSLHPTAKTHRLIGLAMARTLTKVQAPVNLSPVLQLLLE